MEGGEGEEREQRVREREGERAESERGKEKERERKQKEKEKERERKQKEKERERKEVWDRSCWFGRKKAVAECQLERGFSVTTQLKIGIFCPDVIARAKVACCLKLS